MRNKVFLGILILLALFFWEFFEWHLRIYLFLEDSFKVDSDPIKFIARFLIFSLLSIFVVTFYNLFVKFFSPSAKKDMGSNNTSTKGKKLKAIYDETERIKDKEYDFGIEALTDYEKEILILIEKSKNASKTN